VSPVDYEYLRNLLRQRSGLVLSADKQYLLENRLLPITRKIGAAGLSELVQHLKTSHDEPLIVEIVEAMTTNESFFFRDKLPFDHFRDLVIPQLLAARERERRIRIWCAAASTGQEPYSLAMCLSEMGNRLAGWQIEILATDISNDVLERARSGIYSHFEVQRGLPIQLLIKYFTQIGDRWQIAPQIRGMVKYHPRNLLHDFSRLGVFDLVICRNVLMYFSQDTKADVLHRLSGSTAADGFLMLGAAETVIGHTRRFRPIPNTRCLYARSDAVCWSGDTDDTVVPFVQRRAAAMGRA
jgi:chemotaxis protein methyltransferase CheR